MPAQNILDLKGRRITVMGLGLFGGGSGVARFLAERGAEVTVTDLRREGELKEALQTLEGLPVQYRLGCHKEEDFSRAHLIVANPAVPPESPFLNLARQRSVPVETEVSLFLQNCPGKVIAVTGSNGKSTTTVLTGEIVKEGPRRTWVGGNVGGSLLANLEEMSSGDWIVVELSSFQLEYLGALHWKPEIAVLTNLTPNHLDRHKTMENYAGAKKNIIRFQGENDRFLYLQEDPWGRAWAQEAPGRSLPFSAQSRLEEGAWVDEEGLWLGLEGKRHRLGPLSLVKIPGSFNLCNVLAASLAGFLAGVDPPGIAGAVEGFAGVEHRLEYVDTVDGIRYYNDSVSTTPESTMAALEAMPSPVVLILGGYDKGIPFEEMAQVVREKAVGAVLIGQVAQRLEELLRRDKGPEIRRAVSVEEAVRHASRISRPGTTVVLSPGCASYGMFRNYVDRGRAFKEAVKKLTSPAL